MLANFDFHSNNTSQKVGAGATKCCTSKTEEHMTAKWANFQQVSEMTGYERGIEERQSVLDVKMDRGCKNCKNNCETTSEKCSTV